MHTHNPVSCETGDPNKINQTPKDILGFSPVLEEPQEIIRAELNDDNLVALENPVVNPPFNNWSVNQPSAPHDSGLNK